MKDFENASLVLLFFIPGGYHHANTARCWASLTALMVGRKLPQDVPDHKVNTANGRHRQLTQDQGFEGLNLGSGRKPFPVAFSVGFCWWDNCVDLFKKLKNEHVCRVHACVCVFVCVCADDPMVVSKKFPLCCHEMVPVLFKS